MKKTMEQQRGARFREWREAFGFSRQDIATKTNLSPQTIQNMEAGTQMAQFDNVLTRLGVSPAWIVSGKGSMWITGTDDENVARIKAGSKTPASAESESFIEIKKELERYRDREDRLQRIIDKLIGGGNSFRKTLSSASFRTQKSVA